jgi:hypothetical protein
MLISQSDVSVTDELESIWKKVVMALSRHYPGTWLEEVAKKNISLHTLHKTTLQKHGFPLYTMFITSHVLQTNWLLWIHKVPTYLCFDVDHNVSSVVTVSCCLRCYSWCRRFRLYSIPETSFIFYFVVYLTTVCRASNVRMIMNNKFKRKRWSWPNLRYYHWIWLQDLRRKTLVSAVGVPAEIRTGCLPNTISNALYHTCHICRKVTSNVAYWLGMQNEAVSLLVLLWQRNLTTGPSCLFHEILYHFLKRYCEPKRQIITAEMSAECAQCMQSSLSYPVQCRRNNGRKY